MADSNTNIVYHLVKDNRFWDIEVSKKTTSIKSGKVGCKGRSYGSKDHPSASRAQQFALRQVNAKIIQGFVSLIDHSRHETLSPSKSALRRGQSVKTPVAAKQPPKKSQTIRRLAQLQRVESAKKRTATATPEDAKSWRKPPKKQTTIRRIARGTSLQRISTSASSSHQTPQKVPLSSRKSSVVRQTTQNQLNTQGATLKRSDTRKMTETPTTAPAWRKPPKKQSTVRRVAKSISVVKRKPSPDLSQSRSGNTVAKEMVKTPDKGSTWRKPPKKQSTVRRVAKNVSIAKIKSHSSQSRSGNTEKKETPDKGPVWKKPPKKQSTVRHMAKNISIAKMKSDMSRSGSANSKKSSSQSSKPKVVEQKKTPAISRGNTVRAKLLKRQLFESDMPKLQRNETLPATAIQGFTELQQQLDKSKRTFGSPSSSLDRMPSLTMGSDDVYIPPRKDRPLRLKKCPILWEEQPSEEETTKAYAIYVDRKHCVYGNDEGIVTELDPTGHISCVYKVSTEVKCILKEDGFLYAGCGDGDVYEISSGQPRCVYVSPFSQFNEVQSMTYYHGMLYMSNVRGQVVAITHDGTIKWNIKGQGDGGWMLCVDRGGVYHGHSNGVTKYRRDNGQTLWHQDRPVNVFSGTKGLRHVYAASNIGIQKISKSNGSIMKTYEEEKADYMLSVSVGGGLLFGAGTESIICYEEKSGLLLYTISIKALAIQYHQGRLYCVGEGGLQVLDLTRDAILAAKMGHSQKSIKIVREPSIPIPALQKVSSVSKAARGSVTVECVEEGGQLKVRPVTNRFNVALTCEFPVHLRKKGSRFVVDDLKANDSCGFYRVMGNIEEIE